MKYEPSNHFLNFDNFLNKEICIQNFLARWGKNWSIIDSYFQINFQNTTFAFFFYIVLKLCFEYSNEEGTTNFSLWNIPIPDRVKNKTKWGRNISELFLFRNLENKMYPLYIFCDGIHHRFQYDRYAN